MRAGTVQLPSSYVPPRQPPLSRAFPQDDFSKGLLPGYILSTLTKWPPPVIFFSFSSSLSFFSSLSPDPSSMSFIRFLYPFFFFFFLGEGAAGTSSFPAMAADAASPSSPVASLASPSALGGGDAASSASGLGSDFSAGSAASVFSGFAVSSFGFIDAQHFEQQSPVALLPYARSRSVGVAEARSERRDQRQKSDSRRQ